MEPEAAQIISLISVLPKAFWEIIKEILKALPSIVENKYGQIQIEIKGDKIRVLTTVSRQIEL